MTKAFGPELGISQALRAGWLTGLLSDIFFPRLRARQTAIEHSARVQRERQELQRLGPEGIAQMDSWDAQSSWISVFHQITNHHAGANALEIFALEDSPENRLRILQALLTTFVQPEMTVGGPDITQETEYRFKHDVETWFGRYLQTFFAENTDQQLPQYQNEHSLFRHLYRTGTLLKILVAEIQERAAHKNATAIAAMSELNPHMAFIIGFFHDIGRYITHSSKHDEYVLQLLEKINLKPEIVHAKHHPVSLDAETTQDTPCQMLSRIADVFGKLVVDDAAGTPRLRTSIDELISYSLELQLQRYFKNERNQADTMWFQKTEEDVKQYVAKEKELLETAAHWLSEMGLDLEHLLTKTSDVLNQKFTLIQDANRYIYYK